MALKSKYAASLLVEIEHFSDPDKAQEWLDMVSPSTGGLSPREVLAIAYETLQSAPYRSAEQDGESAYHRARALREIIHALEKSTP